ncbi:MAG: sterol-binding protein [Alcaligenaceae bacterium]|jgi:predicted lipid carrier protein YhbT|nr:sterol-binding protein [Alcaligenaceae bacterium]
MDKPFLLPPFVKTVFSKLPSYPGTFFFVNGLNLLLKKHLPEDVLARLEEKKLRLVVKDAGIAFDYSWRNRAFVACGRHPDEPDLIISSSLYDYWQMIQRKEDPDTLFFSRRMMIEGDTELGLMVKNTLDGIDLSVLSPEQVLKNLPGMQVISRLVKPANDNDVTHSSLR